MVLLSSLINPDQSLVWWDVSAWIHAAGVWAQLTVMISPGFDWVEDGWKPPAAAPRKLLHTHKNTVKWTKCLCHRNWNTGSRWIRNETKWWSESCKCRAGNAPCGSLEALRKLSGSALMGWIVPSRSLHASPELQARVRERFGYAPRPPLADWELSAAALRLPTVCLFPG